MASARARRWRELVDQADRLLADLEAGAELLDRAASPGPTFDGYPGSTGGDVGRGGGGDPVGSMVVGHLEGEANADHIAEAARDMRAQLLEALRHLRAAHRALARGKPRLPAHRPPGVETTLCVNCERHGVSAIAVKAGRCWACYGYRQRHPQRLDAPERLVRARPENSTRRQRAATDEFTRCPHGHVCCRAESDEHTHFHDPSTCPSCALARESTPKGAA